jgi:hypothetical protein
MSKPPTQIRPKAAPRQGSGGTSYEECEHLVREDDENTALCGIDQTDVPWNQGFPVCEACQAVAQGRMS